MPIGVYVRTEACKKSLSEARKGKVISDEVRAKISSSLKMVQCSSRFKPGNTPPNKKDWSVIDRVIREEYPTKGHSIADGLGISRGSLHSRASKIGVRFIGKRNLTDEQKKKIGDSMKAIKKGDEWKRNLSIALNGRKHNQERLKAIAEGVRKSRNKKKTMTKPERLVDDGIKILFGYNYSDTLYSGSGPNMKKIRFGDTYRFPDLICKSQKKIIEVFGRYWHRNDNPDDVVNEYRKSGWECLIVWDDDIDMNTWDRIHEFLYPFYYEEELRNVNSIN